MCRLWEKTHVKEVISLNPIISYYMYDFSHLSVAKLDGCFKRLKVNEKEVGIGPLKYLLTIISSNCLT